MGTLPSKAAKAFALPAPKLAPGNYKILWRAVGDDGHVVQGKIAFRVTGP
jgi:methionine-rich copper-binding protein CopC